ncbi:hypothetical protein [Nostoc sp.]|uniref:hypothetical protein n=1 Tax=Nostoc sp. TaxID=1180 RepID=UPI002FF85BC6
MSNLVLQGPSVSTTATCTTHIPVVEKVLDRILEAMEKAGWEWDGTLNTVDDFYRETKNYDWWDLTPRRKNARKIYVMYIYTI